VKKIEKVQTKLKELKLPQTSKTKRNDEKVILLNQLKRIQNGTMPQESIIKKVSKPSKAAESSRHKEIERNRQEIIRLNQKIQEKIETKIKPRLLTLLNKPPTTNGLTVKNNATFSTHSSMSLPKLIIPTQVFRNKQQKNEPLLVKKTHIKSPNSGNETDIYRYTISQLNQMQDTATWKMVPRLLKLKILKTQLDPVNELIFRLIEAPDDERDELIMKTAATRKLIERKSLNVYTYLPCTNANQEPNLLFNSIRDNYDAIQNNRDFKKEKVEADFITQLRLIANNDDELNQLIYEHEFKNLFDKQDMKSSSIAEIVQHLIDTDQAYIVEGEVRVNQRNNQEAYVSHPKGMKDVCITKMILRKQAFHGDLVRVLVKKDSGDLLNTSFQSNSDVQSPNNINDPDISEILQLEPSPENRNFGCVLDIIEKRHSRRVIGSFANFSNVKKNRKYLNINVRDQKVPNVRVDSRTGIPKDVELTERLLLTVEITNWIHDFSGSLLPQGTVTSILGRKGQLKTENVAILQQNNLDPLPFPQEIINQLPSEPFVIPAEEFKYREDLRSKCIFSIDPETARDLDDALSCEKMANGNFEVGVHISDVSYFVKENSDLDNIVKEKATTIYLIDKVYHMLPEQLCLLCSLLPGADKFSYSVFFEIDPNTAEIYNTRFVRSVINSCGKLSYDHAQMVIEDNVGLDEMKQSFPEIMNGFNVQDVAEVIKQLQKLAVILRTNRKTNGALKIDQPKLSFKFAKDDQRMEAPIDFAKYCTKDSNRLIEEFMLLANIHVAKFIHEKFPHISLLRSHSPPNENALKKLVKMLNKQGLEFDCSSSTATSKSMEAIVNKSKYPESMSAALNHLVSRSMQRAKYFCSEMVEDASEFWHYALSIPIYTHFTSPIRRYADILVHRVLNAALDYEPAPTRTPDEVQALATVCNTQKYNAKLAGDDSSNLYFMHFIQSLKMKTMRASVVGIYEFNLEVVLIDTGHLVKVYYRVILLSLIT
jgi:DIS3-like exonuclease 2